MERQPIVAGRFYPAERGECERELKKMFEGAAAPRAVGAIVPHAGWVYSGSTAALAITGVAESCPETLVIFGAVHVPTRAEAAVFPGGRWRTPLGSVGVDEELADEIARCGRVTPDAEVHRLEHSIEVELPLIQMLLPGVSIVPIMVRPGPWAEDVGRACGRAALAAGRKVAVIGSTDLTHYGPAFGFEPHGRGQAGTRWSKEVNDRRMVRLIQRLDATGVISEAAANRNACGAGAVAATIGAMLEMGASKYVELRHCTSAECEEGWGGVEVNSVGYEAGVFLMPS